MPRVPTYGDPNVQLAAAPDLRERRSANADEFGGGIAQGLGQVAGQAGRVYVDERQKAIQQAKQVRLLGLKNEYDNYMAPKLAEWSQRGGLDAQKNITDYRDEHAKVLGQLTADLDEDTAQAFQAWAADSYTGTNRKLLFQAAEQAKVYENNQFKARMDLARTSIVQNYNSEDTVYRRTFDLLQESEAFAERNNMSAEQRDAMQSSIRSMAVRARIEGYLDAGEDLTAERVFKRDKDALTADDLQVMRTAVETGSSKAKAQRAGDEVYLKVAAGDMTAEDAITKLAEIENPKVRDMATAHYRSQMAMRNEARAAETTVAWDDAMRALAENDGQITAVSTATMTRLMQLDPSSVGKLNSIATNWDPGRQTDSMAWLSLRQDAAEGKLAGMDVVAFHAAYHDKFSRADWDNAVAMWGQSKEASKNPEKAAAWAGVTDGVRSEIEMFKTVLLERGYNYDEIMKRAESDRESPQVREALQVITALDQAVADRKRELGVEQKRKVDKLPPEEMHKVVSRTLQAISEKGKDPWGPGDYRNLPQFRAVPEAEAAKIKASWRAKRGSDPTPAEIQEVYFRAQRAAP